MQLSYDQRAADTFATPYPGYTFGTEIHATTAANIINKEWIRRLPIGTEVIIIYLASFLISHVILTIANVSLLITALTSFSIIILWMPVSYLMFNFRLFFAGSLIFFLLVPVVFIVAALKPYLLKYLRNRDLKRSL